jgi:O-antigen/teichoic acid export membrane protein
LEPLSVFAGSLFSANLRGHLKSAAWIHWGIAVVVCFALGTSAFIAETIGHSSVVASALAGIMLAAPFIMAHTFERRAFYLKFSPGPAAFGSGFYFAMLVAGVYITFRMNCLTAFTAFLVMGLASLVSAVVMAIQLNSRLNAATQDVPLKETWARHWEYGRWALAACMVGWIPNYVYIPLTSAFSGMAAAGELRALMNLAAPPLQTFAALSMLFLPYAARRQATRDRAAAYALTRKLTFLFVGGAIAYWAVLVPLRLPVFRLLYNGKYIESVYLVPLFALETIVWSASMGPAILLRAMESPRSLFWANGAASVVALIGGIPATRYYGLKGVVWSMILANALYSTMAFWLHRRKISQLKTVNDVTPETLKV